MKKIPDNFNFRTKRNLKDNIKILLNINNPISFIELREVILNYLHTKKLFIENKIKIIDFKLNKDIIDFNDLDDMIYNLIN